MPDPAKKPISAGKAALIVVASVVGLLALLALFGAIGSPDPEPRPSTPASPDAPAATKPPLGSVAEDGTYKVDDCFGCRPDPGVWESAGGTGPEYCIWMRKSSSRIGADNVLERGDAAPGERTRVRLTQGEYFTTMGCEPWVYVGSN